MRIITRWKSSYTAKKLYPFYLKCYLDNATAADKLKKKGIKKRTILNYSAKLLSQNIGGISIYEEETSNYLWLKMTPNIFYYFLLPFTRS